MDANEISCPKCGHLNNYISEGCVKCGIIFSKYFEMQSREKERTGALGAAAAGQSDQSPVAAAPEPGPGEGTIEMKAEPQATEPPGAPSAETKPVGESPTPPVSEISLDEIEVPIEAVSDTIAGDKSTAPETPSPAETESTGKPADDHTADPVRLADAAPAESEVQAKDQASIQEPQAHVTEEASKESSAPSVRNKEAAPVEDLLELSEPAQPKAEAKTETETRAETEPVAKTETKLEEVRSQTPSQSEQTAGAEPAKNDLGTTAVAEKDKREMPAKAAPQEAEAEILLKEVAEPVKAETKSEKSEDSNRAVLLQKQKAALVKAETLKQEKEAQVKATALKKQKLAQAKLEALKKQKAAQAKVEALKKHKAKALKKKKAEAKIEALKQQKLAQAAVETKTQETQAMVKASSENLQSLAAKAVESNLKIMALLKKYVGKTIGINYDNSAEIKEAELVEANDEFFSVAVKDAKLQYSYPLQTLLSLIEGEDGVESEESENKAKYSAVIKVYPLVLF